MFWTFLILEIIAWVQIGRGLWGNPGASPVERAGKQQARADGFLGRAEQATAAGQDPARFEKMAENIGRAAEKILAEATALNADATTILFYGLGLLAPFRIVQGLCADIACEKRYSK